jgi:hypothetical protein
MATDPLTLAGREAADLYDPARCGDVDAYLDRVLAPYEGDDRKLVMTAFIVRRLYAPDEPPDDRPRPVSGEIVVT